MNPNRPLRRASSIPLRPAVGVPVAASVVSPLATASADGSSATALTRETAARMGSGRSSTAVFEVFVPIGSRDLRPLRGFDAAGPELVTGHVALALHPQESLIQPSLANSVPRHGF